MKKILLFLLAFFVLVTGGVYSRTTSVQRTLERLPRRQFTDFRQLSYRMYLFGLIPVAEARLIHNGIEDLDGREVIHLSGTGSTAPYLAALIKGSISVDSYIDKATGYPRLFTQTLRVAGRPDNVKQIVYDQESGIMRSGETKREVEPGIQDPISAFFHLTRTDFDSTGTIGMDLNSNQKTYLLQGTAARARSTVRKDSCGIVTVKAHVRRKDKNPYHTSRMTLVLSEQHAHAPVIIKVFAGGVLITAQLTDFQ